MTSRLGAMIWWDIGLQVRSHFYTATLLTTLVICGLILLIPFSPLPPKLMTLLIFIDPAVVGLTFVGAFVLMDKGANTLAALCVTPLPGSLYVASKIVSFTLLGVACGVTIALVASRAALNVPLALVALVLSNVVAVMIGFSLIARAKSVNIFLRNIIAASIVLTLPVIVFFDLVPPLIAVPLIVIPTYAMLVTLEASLAFGDPGADTAAAIIYLLIWAAAGWFWAVREYDRHLSTGGL